MGLKYYSREANSCKEFPSISSNADLPIYANLSSISKKIRQCSIPKASSSVENSSHTGPYANIHTYASVQTQNTMTPAIQTSDVYQTNNYFNISMLSSKQTNQQTDGSYGKLLNTTSTAPRSKLMHTADENNNRRIYENMKTYSSSFASTKIHQTLSNPSSSSSSIRTYINFEYREDTSQIISLPSPSNKEKDIDDAYSPIHRGKTKSSDIETNVLETNSNANTTKVSLIFSFLLVKKNVNLFNIFRREKSLKST